MQPIMPPAPAYGPAFAAPISRLERIASNYIFRERDRMRLAWAYENPARAEHLRSISYDLQDYRELIDQEIQGEAPVLDTEPE